MTQLTGIHEAIEDLNTFLWWLKEANNNDTVEKAVNLYSEIPNQLEEALNKLKEEHGSEKCCDVFPRKED